MSTALFLLSIWCYVLLSVFVPCAWNAFLILSAYVCFDIGVAGVVRDLFIYLCGNTTVLSIVFLFKESVQALSKIALH